MTDGQNTRDQITMGRTSKRASPNCVLCIPLILSGSPNNCWLHICDACVTTSWGLGLRAPRVARNQIKYLIILSPYGLFRDNETTRLRTSSGYKRLTSWMFHRFRRGFELGTARNKSS